MRQIEKFKEFLEKHKPGYRPKIWEKGDKQRIYLDVGKKGVKAYFEYINFEGDDQWDESVSVASGSAFKCFAKTESQSKWWWDTLRDEFFKLFKETGEIPVKK